MIDTTQQVQAFERLKDFVQQYQGDPIGFLLLGGGGLLGILPCIPGCSRVLDNIVLPYSKEAQDLYLYRKNKNFKQDNPQAISCVSLQWLNVMLFGANSDGWSPLQKRILACTAALATNRYRKGPEQAIIGDWLPWDSANNEGGRRVLTLLFHKPSAEEFGRSSDEQRQQRRLEQEWAILDTSLDLLLGKPLSLSEVRQKHNLAAVHERWSTRKHNRFGALQTHSESWCE